MDCWPMNVNQIGDSPGAAHDRSRFALVGAIDPCETQRFYVGLVDLLERAVVLSGVIAMIGWPRVYGRPIQQFWIKRALAGEIQG